MKTRRAFMELTYNGTEVSKQLMGYMTEVSYTDPAGGEADSLDISVQDRSRRWLSAWLPVKGDTMKATIRATDWDRVGDHRSLPCGFFILDDFNFSGWPVTGTISGVSVPADSAFRETKRTKTWEKVTVKEIGTEIARRAGISLVWDVPGDPFVISCLEQSGQTDCEFYMSLCQNYGYSMKVYARRIVVFDRETYKAKASVLTIRETDIENWNGKKSLAGTYTGGVYTYTDPVTEEEVRASVGAGSRILELSGSADGKADAERRITAAVLNANHGADSLSVSIMGNARLAAGQCVTVVGLGRFSGKYYVDKITHRVGKKYVMDLDMSLVADMTAEVIRDAINRLWAVGVISTPSYWESHYRDVSGLNGLLLDLATGIKVNVGGTGITTVPAALDVLAARLIISDKTYWAEKYAALSWLGQLLINAANALTK